MTKIDPLKAIEEIYGLKIKCMDLEEDNKRMERENERYQEALIHIINESYSYKPSIAKMSIIATEALENSEYEKEADSDG